MVEVMAGFVIIAASEQVERRFLMIVMTHTAGRIIH